MANGCIMPDPVTPLAQRRVLALDAIHVLRHRIPPGCLQRRSRPGNWLGAGAVVVIQQGVEDLLDAHGQVAAGGLNVGVPHHGLGPVRALTEPGAAAPLERRRCGFGAVRSQPVIIARPNEQDRPLGRRGDPATHGQGFVGDTPFECRLGSLRRTGPNWTSRMGGLRLPYNGSEHAFVADAAPVRDPRAQGRTAPAPRCQAVTAVGSRNDCCGPGRLGTTFEPAGALRMWATSDCDYHGGVRHAAGVPLREAPAPARRTGRRHCRTCPSRGTRRPPRRLGPGQRPPAGTRGRARNSFVSASPPREAAEAAARRVREASRSPPCRSRGR